MAEAKIVIFGIAIENREEAEIFKQVYEKFMKIYDEFSKECSETHKPKPCIGTHILFPTALRLMRTVDKLRDRGWW